MSTRLLLFAVALALLWTMPPRRRRGRGRQRTEEERLRAWRDRLRQNPHTHPHEWEDFSTAWNDFNVRKARREIRPKLRRRPQLIHSKRDRRRGRGRGLTSAFRIGLVITIGILLACVVAGIAGIQPFTTYTNHYLPFTKAQEPAPHPAVAVATDTPAPTATVTSTPPNPTTTPLVSKTVPLPTVTPTLSFVPPTPTPPPLALAPTSTPVPPTATPTPIPPPHLRHIEAKSVMLELINEERERVGVPLVEMGDNWVAQLHAELALANCFSSHWGIDGLTPYMRYSLAGGYQSNGENGSGLDYCYTEADFVKPLKPLREEMADSVKGFMGSLGHRENLLYKHHRKVNIGIALNKYNIRIYQHFEGDHVEYDALPAISSDGILTLAGTTKNGATFDRDGDLGMAVYYHQPPHNLTRGQVSRTFCYGFGSQVAGVRRPLTDGSRWVGGDTFILTESTCPDPYDIALDAPAPQSEKQAVELWEEAHDKSNDDETREDVARWITASRWNVDTTSFDVAADLSDLLNKHGKGVYTVAVWANLGEDYDVVSQYSIWHGITPPKGYQHSE